MPTKPNKALRSLNETLAGFLCDVWDAAFDFFTKPYFAERILSRLEQTRDKLRGRRAVRKEKRARKKNVAEATVIGILRRKAVKYASIAALSLAAAVLIVFCLPVIAGIVDIPLDVIFASKPDASAEGKSTAVVSQSDSTLPQENEESINSDDAQAVQYAFVLNKNDGIQPLAKPQKPAPAGGDKTPSAQKKKEPRLVYIGGEEKLLRPDHYKHDARFADGSPELMVDVSSNQGIIDWEKVAETEVKSAMIRIGYRGRESGDVFEDPFWEDNLSGATENGLRVGAYFYSQAITEEEAVEEAKFLLSKIKGASLPLPVAIDFEYESMSVYGELSGRLYEAKLSREEATKVVEAFCNEVMEAGYAPMVYANEDMLSNSLNADVIAKNSYVWLACYADKTKYQGEYSFWQFTDSGIVPGISSYVCLDFRYKNVKAVD